MTSKKTKIHDLTYKSDFKYRLKEVEKKNQSASKRIVTVRPLSNEEDTPKRDDAGKKTLGDNFSQRERNFRK
jgi:hypothetical protein